MNNQWKEAERKLAKIFGTTRRPLSGMTHTYNGTGGDDCMHDKLYLESKYTGSPRSPYNGAIKLFQDTENKAHKEKKIPVVGLRKKHAKGCILMINSQDLETVLREFASAQGIPFRFAGFEPDDTAEDILEFAVESVNLSHVSSLPKKRPIPKRKSNKPVLVKPTLRR